MGCLASKGRKWRSLRRSAMTWKMQDPKKLTSKLIRRSSRQSWHRRSIWSANKSGISLRPVSQRPRATNTTWTKTKSYPEYK